MTQADKARFKKLMIWAETATRAPYGKDLSGLGELLFEELQPYPFELVEAAVKAHCRTGGVFPMLADILKLIEGSTEDRAQWAWGLVLHARQECGRWYGVRFPDPAIHYAIRLMGGWHVVACTPNSELHWLADRFPEYYAAGRRRASWETEAAFLPGINDVVGVYDVEHGEKVPREVFEGRALTDNQAAELVALVAEGMRVSA